MEQKEKDICIGDKKMANVRPFDRHEYMGLVFFISQWLYKIAESMLDLVCSSIYRLFI